MCIANKPTWIRKNIKPDHRFHSPHAICQGPVSLLQLQMVYHQYDRASPCAAVNLKPQNVLQHTDTNTSSRVL
jgi:hypothetical protein